MRTVVIKIIILGVVITLGGIAAFYVFRSQKPISPISSKPQDNKILFISEKQPSKTLKEYTDDSGFSFKYPDDVVVTKKVQDSNTYANLELISNQTKGSISIKVADTKLKSVDDFFKDGLGSVGENKKEIKIGEISGSQKLVDNKLLGAAIDQDILFTIEVAPENQKYWLKVYDTILSSFNFVFQQSTNTSETKAVDESSNDVVLEEEIVE